MWRTRMTRAFSSTKHIRCSAAANMAGELRSTSASRTDSPWCMARFQKRSEHWAVSSPVPRKRCNICVSTRIQYVYSCALPPVVIAAILKALELGTSQPELRAKLWENADYFHAQLDKLGFDTGASTTYVMPIVIGDRELMYRLGHELRRRGLWVAPVDYPAVPQNRICFRACVTAKHTRADLDEALNILEDTLVPALLQKQSA